MYKEEGRREEAQQKTTPKRYWSLNERGLIGKLLAVGTEDLFLTFRELYKKKYISEVIASC